MEEIPELWRPSTKRIERARLKAFINKFGLPEGYSSLHGWCSLREQASARHVPHRIHAVAEFPPTRSGKLAVKAVVNGRAAASTEGLANPAALDQFATVRGEE